MCSFLGVALVVWCTSLAAALTTARLQERRPLQHGIREEAPVCRHRSLRRADFAVFATPNRRQTFSATNNNDNDHSNDILLDEVKHTQSSVLGLLRKHDFDGALDNIRMILSQAERAQGGTHATMAAILDETVQAYTNVAFSEPFRGARSRHSIQHGLGAIQLQLSSASPPYNTLPKATFVSALKSLTAMVTRENVTERDLKNAIDAAFRILQRLVTGVGVRGSHLSERDFNLVLNAVSNVGRMDLAHKIVALQERTSHAPPLSPVAYSILLKGYGRLRDLRNVEMILSHAQVNGIVPDTVMLNSMMDAFVNCNNLDAARHVFQYMRDPESNSRGLSRFGPLFSAQQRPPPNRRSYNTMLKGLARVGCVQEAMEIANEMKDKKLWDSISTNTLVSAAVKAQDFELAESILANSTALSADVRDQPPPKKHPNVEAYTELLNGFASASRLDKALGTLQLMRKRGVQPNVYTYTCVISALTRAKKIEQAIKLLEFMESTGVKPNVVTYNAFLSGLIAEDVSVDANARHVSHPQQRDSSATTNHWANEAVRTLRRMLNAGVRPNAITVSLLVDALGRCEPPRIREAKALVGKLEEDEIIQRANTRVATSLVRACGRGHDFLGAMTFFRKIQHPDTVAVNALMDAACRCGHEKVAFETFEHFFGKSSEGKIRPDVITYSVLIKTLLTRHSTAMAMDRVRLLYSEMKNKRRIMPDNALVDTILTAMVRGGRIGLRNKDVQFTLNVIRDAKNLEWETGEYEKRKQAVRAVMVGRLSEVWKEDESWYGMGSKGEEEEDELFRRKGWNKVDSGFSLWGGGLPTRTNPHEESFEDAEDEFLASKGWNNVDSGFRIL